jgi:hypothetical protein
MNAFMLYLHLLPSHPRKRTPVMVRLKVDLALETFWTWEEMKEYHLC